jgi:hypothetical protein
MKALPLFSYSRVFGLKKLLIVATLIGAQAFVLSSAQASKPNAEPFALIERHRITETIEPNGTVIEVTEMTTLINSQLAVDSESQADLPYNSTFANSRGTRGLHHHPARSKDSSRSQCHSDSG